MIIWCVCVCCAVHVCSVKYGMSFSLEYWAFVPCDFVWLLWFLVNRMVVPRLWAGMRCFSCLFLLLRSFLRLVLCLPPWASLSIWMKWYCLLIDADVGAGINRIVFPYGKDRLPLVSTNVWPQQAASNHIWQFFFQLFFLILIYRVWNSESSALPRILRRHQTLPHPTH